MGASQQIAIQVDALIYAARSLQAYHLCIVDTLDNQSPCIRFEALHRIVQFVQIFTVFPALVDADHVIPVRIWVRSAGRAQWVIPSDL